MAFINEEINHESGITIEVLEYENTENNTDKKAICSLEVSDICTRMTPVELEELGVWLIEQASHIRTNYSRLGKPKHKKAA